MSFVLLGILNSQVDAAGGGAYELIESNILTASASSVTFSSIPQDYKHLQVRLVARTNRADFQDTLGVRLNGISSGSYATHTLRGNNTSVISSASTSATSIFGQQAFDLFGANETANAFGLAILDVLNYSNIGTTSVVRYESGVAGGTQTDNVNLISGFNPSDTSALTSITFISRNSASFVANSRFSLYGIRGE